MAIIDIKESLSDHDLAWLHAKFVVPIVVDHMLRDEEPLDDIAEYAMGEILCGLYPDAALLCIALCTRHIARETEHLPISRALIAEADQIIDEYGPLWISREKNPGSIDDAVLQEMLVNIPEDFEALRDLLEATMTSLEEDHCVAAILYDILSLQADYQHDIAEAELQNLYLHPRKQNTVKNTEQSHSNNVILFPTGMQKQRQPAQS
ncbi:MAG: hypothetical protein CO093_10350 [Alphaproteobacteria bacterium CG_4_9_14_3_um_filter_47_13]|nr:MAG: hypothetical protein CO093_10350 [Alphaproteobacteria bacterium CG_4_9_14_3_um_filter_47_13]